MTNTNDNIIAHAVSASIVEEWSGEDDNGAVCYDDLSAYCLFRVVVNGTEYRVGACVGVPDHLRSTADAAGSIVGLVDAWWEDASDWQDLPDLKTRDAVLDHLCSRARRLFDQAMALR